MTPVHRLGKRVRNARAHPDRRGLLDAKLHRDDVCRPEPDSAYVLGKPVGFSVMTSTAAEP